MISFNTDSLLMVPQLNIQKSKFKGQKKLDLDDIVAKEASSTLTLRFILQRCGILQSYLKMRIEALLTVVFINIRKEVHEK